MDCHESRCDSRNDNKTDCREKSSDFSSNNGISVDCHDFLRSLAMTVIKKFSLEFCSLNLKQFGIKWSKK